MAHRENITNGYARFTMSPSEMIALQQILDKISRDMSMTTLHQYDQAGSLAKLFNVNQKPGEFRIPL